MTLWVDVPGYEGHYQVSDDGMVRSFKYSNLGRSLTPKKNGRGYRAVGLSLNGKVATFLVHQLVMAAFIGPKPDDMHVCHNNGDPADNRLSNLRYDTPSANALDSVAHGTCYQAEKARCPAGHLYDADNTRWVKTAFGSGKGRQCRKCDRDRQLAKRSANREKYNAAARQRRAAKRQLQSSLTLLADNKQNL